LLTVILQRGIKIIHVLPRDEVGECFGNTKLYYNLLQDRWGLFLSKIHKNWLKANDTLRPHEYIGPENVYPPSKRWWVHDVPRLLRIVNMEFTL